jgi:phosphatidylinositol-3-phosphatase
MHSGMDYSMIIPPMSRRAFLRRATAASTYLLLRPRAAGRWWSSLVWGVFENRAFTDVTALPSHRRLAREGTLLAQYFAVAHPSGPNYRAMASGRTWGDAEVIDTFHPTIGGEAHLASPPIPTYIYHLAGEIARKHNPFVDLHAPIAGVRSGLDALRTDLASGLPDTCLVYVGWDDADDLHNGDAARADHNLACLLDTLAASRWFTTPDRSGRYPVFFFCYDEDDGRHGNRVFAAWWGRGVRPGRVSDLHHTHYGFCRTVTENWGLSPLELAASEGPIAEPWA